MMGSIRWIMVLAIPLFLPMDPLPASEIISALKVHGNQADLLVQTEPNRLYDVEFSGGLTAENTWRELPNRVTGTGGEVVIRDTTIAGVKRRFYRVRSTADHQLPVPFDADVQYERTLHVSAGAPPGGTGSPVSPFDAINPAAAAALPGTRILVDAGSYPQADLGSLRGEAGRPIALQANGRVVIDAGGGLGLRMSDGEWVVIEGLTIENAGIHGMNLDDGGSFDTPSHHIVLRDIEILSAGSGGNNDCIKLSGVEDFWVLDCTIAGANRGELIDMVGCHRGVIHGNHFRDAVQNGVQTKGGSSDIVVHGNLFEGIASRAMQIGGSTGLNYFRPPEANFEAARIRVLSNLFLNNGPASGCTVSFVGCDECVFANNTVIGQKTWLVRILQENTNPGFVPSRNGFLINNLFVIQADDIRAYANVGSNTAPGTFTFANNLYFATDRDASWQGPQWGNGILPEQNAIVQQDPLLQDPLAGNCCPTAASPAISQGIAVPLGGLPGDFDGRPYGFPPTIGAFELVNGV